MRASFIHPLCSLLFLSALSACGGDDKPKGEGSGASSSGGSGPSSGGRPTTVGGGPGHSGPMFAGAECPDIGLPAAYALSNVQAIIEGSNARITFDPQGDARDYRVYALPTADQVSGNAITGATYRCAGNYAVPYPAVEEEMPAQWWVRTRVTSPVKEYTRSMDDATLGYVFTTPGDGRIPVYAVGDPNIKADNASCYYMRWPETRVKRYLTDKAERDDLISKRWRDDGIAFYVPEAGTDGTEPVYWGTQPPMDYSAEFHFTAGPEYDDRTGKGIDAVEQFSVYTEPQEGAEPLMRVFYEHVCARGHDELVAGLARFNKAYFQGAQPNTELHFSGLTEETTLVVEALDDLCPFQGVVSPGSRPAASEPFEDIMIHYPPYQTPEELAAASATGEVFINGQGADTAPQVISRACLKVTPEPAPEMDFFYDGSPEEFGEATYRNYQIYEMESPNFNVQYTSVATDEWAIGTLFGELWTTYSDKAADTNGKFRMTPKTRATLASDSFVHVTMEVDAISSQRRYPQILVSTAEWPVQDNLPDNVTVVLQLFGGVTEALEGQIEFCDHRNWDVNDQCPKFPLYVLKDGDESFISPAPEINGLLGADRTLRFDVYVSTDRVYFYVNTRQYGCVNLPAGKLPAGPATVTYGDVLYHSGVDLEAWYPYHVERMQTVTSRHFSNFGFSSGIAAPSWDETLVPCVAASDLK